MSEGGQVQVQAAENLRPFPGTPDPQTEVGEAERQQPKKWGTEERGRSWDGRWLGWSRRQEPAAPARRSLGDPFCGRAVKGGWKEVIYANHPNEAEKKKQTIIWKGSDLFPPSSMSAVTTDAPQGRTPRISRCCSVNAMLPVVINTLRHFLASNKNVN